MDVIAHSALPGPLRLQPSFPFVDRPREMATLRSLLPRAQSEGRRIALVGGEPGSGKSRLVREIAHQAAEDGALVLYGACDAVVRTPYRPFVEALDQLVRASDPAELRADLGPAGGELTRLLPDLRSHVGDLPEPVVADQDTERHRLNAAVSDLLVAAGCRRPLLLVFEDGHWADTPTLLLLRHLAAGAADARMLLVATFRDTEADVPAELSEALIDMRRSDGVVRVRVGALTGEQVSEFVERAAGAPLGPALPELAGAITSLTQGNVFLVTELWRELVETGALEIVDGVAILTRPLSALGTPESVREVVNQRLARLQPETALVLELAAVTGPEFDLSVLRGGGFSDATLSAALEQSLRSGMIEEIPARQLRYRFSPRARTPRPVRPAGGTAPGRAAPAGGRVDGGVRRRRHGAGTGRPRPPLRRRRAHRRSPAGGRVQPSGGGRRQRRTGVRRGRRPAANGARAGRGQRDRARRDRAGAGSRALPRRPVRRFPGGVPGGRGDGAAAPQPGPPGTRRDRGGDRLLAGGDARRGRDRAAGGGAGGARSR